MKKKIHPAVREVIFKDVSCGFQIKTRSSVQTKHTVKEGGKTLPLVTFDVSSASHPFYTGKRRLVDKEGRAEKFLKKYKGFQTASSAFAEKADATGQAVAGANRPPAPVAEKTAAEKTVAGKPAATKTKSGGPV